MPDAKANGQKNTVHHLHSIVRRDQTPYMADPFPNDADAKDAEPVLLYNIGAFKFELPPPG